MRFNKKSYYLGTHEPAPKKQKYKPEKAIVVQPRFKEPFYRNYDLYNAEGVNGAPKHGPGKGYHELMEHKSIKDFRDSKKSLKEKYKADDSYIMPDGSISKNEKKSKQAWRVKVFNSIIKTAIDFPLDEQMTDPVLGDSGTYSDSVPIGGATDEYLTMPDTDQKTVDKLNFSHDIEDDSHDPGSYFGLNKEELSNKIDKMLELYLNHDTKPDLYGLPDGLPNEENVEDISDDMEYGTTDSGNTLYDKMWI